MPLLVSDLAERRKVSRQIRDDAAETQFLEPEPIHSNNGDEARFANKIGSSTKGLRHDATKGEVIRVDYDALIAALRDGSFSNFQTLATNGHLGCTVDPKNRRRFVNPQSAYAFDLEGIDSHQLALRPAPAFDSAEEAGEMVELYWMALLRDTPFASYGTDPDALNAAADLSKLSDFRGPKVGGKVTPSTLFRDVYPGCAIGPYVSQFLLQPVDFGAQRIDTRILTATPHVDFMTTFAAWLNVINGCQPPDAPSTSQLVFAHNGRDLTAYVHRDFLFQAYLVATANLLGHTSAAPGDGGYLADEGNPYGQFIDPTGTGRPLPVGASGSLADIGFGTFGPPAIATLVCEAATRALKHQWYQKWLVHRRVRPEEFGGHVEVQRLGRATYPFDKDLLNSPVLAAIQTRFGSHLLPQAFPEGSPMHPSYASGHATVAGACVTVLKWFFDESTPIQRPQVPNPAGPGTLVPYVAPANEAPLTVGGELNKLASNISQARNIAGVHWRSDATEGNKLGEEVAISMLRELSDLYNEPYNGSSLTKFDGTTITV